MRLTTAQMLDESYLAERARLIDPKRAQRFGHGHAAARRHDLPQRRRRARHDGELHPEQLHGLRLGRRRSRLGHLAAEPRPRLRPRPDERELRRAGQAPVPHHHPGLPHQRRPGADELRRDGRQHAAAGPPADARAHAGARPAAAGRVRCAALALQPGARDQRRGDRWTRRRSRASSIAATRSA